MPAAVAVPLITTAVSTGASIFQSAQANKKAKEARKAIEDYERQTLTNPYEGLQVSTLGADRQREDLGRTMASYGALAAMGGGRAISSILPNLVGQQNAQEAQIAASLDQQEQQRQQLVAQGNSMVQQMNEQRENNDLLGLGNELSQQQQQKAQADNNLMQGLIQGGASIAGGAIASGALGGAESGAGITKIIPGATVEKITPPLLPNSIQTLNLPAMNFNKGNQFQTPSWLMSMNGMYNHPFVKPF